MARGLVLARGACMAPVFAGTVGPAIGHVRRRDRSLGHRERGERKAESVGGCGRSKRGGSSKHIGVSKGTGGGREAPVVVGKGKVLLEMGKCVSSSRQFAPFFAVQGEQARVRNDFVACANSRSFRDGVVTVNGESDGLVELKKNGFERLGCVPRGVHGLEIFLELGGLDGAVFGPEVRRE
jgi:hypothetical protein